jgi:DNA polymerase elongation subunit (family B)
VSCVDYLDIYKRFCPVLRESYKLDSIGETELGENKIDYGDTNLASLADDNWELFVDYNIQDVNLLIRLEEKLQYLKLLRMIHMQG